jgi:hypothetical protein
VIMQERKWVEGSAALFIASSVVLADRLHKMDRFMSTADINPNDRAIIEYFGWTYDNHFAGFQVELDEKGHNAPKSLDDVEARYHIMQACSHLEASLMDVICTCELTHAHRLFAERAEAPQTFTEIVSRAVETTIFGGVFGVPFRNQREFLGRKRYSFSQQLNYGSGAFVGIPNSIGFGTTPLFYYAPYLSHVNTAVDIHEANCVIDRTGDNKYLVLKLLRPLRAGEELVKLEPRL